MNGRVCGGNTVWFNKCRQAKRGECMPACVCTHMFKRPSVFVFVFCPDSGDHFPEKCLCLYNEQNE